MIVSVFGPCGIVTATSNHDTFFEQAEKDGTTFTRTIGIEGLPHTFTFWGKYVLVYNYLNQQVYDARIPNCFSLLTSKWKTAPAPKAFIPQLKQLIVDNKIQIIGIVSTYFEEDRGVQTPYAYQILGEEIRRINTDNAGNTMFNCVYLEKEPIVGKLLRKTQLLNGDVWEEQNECLLRFDLFSIAKSIDFCAFAIKTNHYISNNSETGYCDTLQMEVAVATTDGIEIIQKNY